jgi:2-iminobutanoate/2-iminopropanoate deaminase
MRTPTAVSTPNAPKAIGPYSQAIACGGFLFLSGQIALDPATGTLKGAGVAEQTEQVMKNISAILVSRGLGLDHLIKTTVYLKSMGDFGIFNETYERFLKAPFPARATIEVSKLPKDALIEIEAVAYLPHD